MVFIKSNCYLRARNIYKYGDKVTIEQKLKHDEEFGVLMVRIKVARHLHRQDKSSRHTTSFLIFWVGAYNH